MPVTGGQGQRLPFPARYGIVLGLTARRRILAALRPDHRFSESARARPVRRFRSPRLYAEFDQRVAGLARAAVQGDATRSAGIFKREASRAYGVLLEELFLSNRAYLLIDADGIVRWAHVEQSRGQRRTNAEMLAAIATR